MHWGRKRASVLKRGGFVALFKQLVWLPTCMSRLVAWLHEIS